jgi:hypothetical protein
VSSSYDIAFQLIKSLLEVLDNGRKCGLKPATNFGGVFSIFFIACLESFAGLDEL